MKKLLLLVLIVMFTAVSCTPTDDTDPLRYKGCVVVRKAELLDGWGIRIKLTHSMRDSLGCDYKWIGTPKWEWDKLSAGDTIK